MKKTLLPAVIISLFHFIAGAQDFPNYGIVPKEELELKECSFDKDANAITLLDEANTYYDDRRHLITDHHIRIKILKEKGLSVANIQIPYYLKDDFENIYNLAAMITNVDADGKTVSEKLNSKSFYKKADNDRTGRIIFTFPGVKVGSIIEYKYQSFMQHYGGLHDWKFQGYLPVVHSRYFLKMAPRLEFAYRISKKDDLPIVIRKEKDAGQIYFEMDSLPGLSNEPYMDARQDYLQKVNFQVSGFILGDDKKDYMTTWQQLNDQLLGHKNFGMQLNKNIAGAEEIIDSIKGKASAEDKMVAIYNYVRSNMKWNRLFGKYTAEGVKEAWDKRQGNSAEINFILIHLLNQAGIEAYPLLVSERFNGKVDSSYPFIDQFNSVFAYVTIKEKKYYLNAIDEYTPAHIIPNSILNTTAFIIKKKDGALINITNDSLQYDNYITLQGYLDSSGIFSGDADMTATDYARLRKITEYRLQGKEKYVKNQYQNDGFSITDFEFLGEKNDSLPLEEKFKFSNNLASSGDYLFIPVNLFSGFNKNPFINDSRFSNINFGYRRKISTYAYINLPKNYAVETLPKNVNMSTPDKDIIFRRSVSYDKETNQLICMLLFDFEKSLYSANDYEILKEVYKKMFDYLKEPVVLKKN